jgi:methionyl-tRNA formyltransferase
MTDPRKNIVLFGASTRAIRFLEKLISLRLDDQIIVLSFREDSWEPPFFESIRDLAVSSGNEFHEMKSVNRSKWNKVLDGRTADVLFAVGWRYLIPRNVYETTERASVVFHDSLLPKYRGFAPTNWAIINGETKTGASMFLMSDTVDSGPIIGQVEIDIESEQTIREVAENVTESYLSLLESNIEGLLSGEYSTTPQDESQATLTTKRVPADGEIDWSSSSESIHNLVRGLGDPWPGAFTTLNGRKLNIWSTQTYDGPVIAGSVPGRVVDLSVRPSVTVATGDGAIMINTVQFEGAEVVGAAEVVRSVSDTLGR